MEGNPKVLKYCILKFIIYLMNLYFLQNLFDKTIDDVCLSYMGALRERSVIYCTLDNESL